MFSLLVKAANRFLLFNSLQNETIFPKKTCIQQRLDQDERLRTELNAVSENGIRFKRKGIEAEQITKFFEKSISPLRTRLEKSVESLLVLQDKTFQMARSHALESALSARVVIFALSLGVFIFSAAIGWFFSRKQVQILFILDKTIADLRKAEGDLQDRNIRLEQAVRSRDEMVGIISHELKNPLTALQMGTALIQRTLPEGPKLENVKKLVDRLRPSAQRMNQLISDLLDVTRLEAQGLKIEPSVCDLSSLAQEVVKSHEACAQEKLVELSCDIQPECREVYCDPNRTIQILINLVNNAIKFTNTGGSISIQAKKLDHQIEVQVRDTGKGIPINSLPYVFDRFWQAKDTAYKGTGLGLSIVKGLVEAQGGKIWVDSQMGIGTTFYFTLPTRKAVSTPKIAVA